MKKKRSEKDLTFVCCSEAELTIVFQNGHQLDLCADCAVTIAERLITERKQFHVQLLLPLPLSLCQAAPRTIHKVNPVHKLGGTK